MNIAANSKNPILKHYDNIFLYKETTSWREHKYLSQGMTTLQ